MSNTDQAPEPTMDEILASIRRIISDEPTDKNAQPADNNVAGDIARALSFGDENAVSGMDEDILELTEVVTPGKNLEDELTETLTQHPPSAPFGEPAEPEMAETADLSPSDILDDFPAPTLTEPGQSQYTEDDQELSIPEDIFSDTAMRSGGMVENPEPPELADNPIEQALEEINKPELGEIEEFTPDMAEFDQPEDEMSSGVDNQSSLETDLEEALSWGVEQADEEDIQASDTDTLGDELDVVGAELSNNLLDVNEEQQEISIDDSLMNDQSVTFGELSPEESIESALENAIGSDDDEDLEQGWLQDDEEEKETPLPAEVQAVLNDGPEFSQPDFSSEEEAIVEQDISALDNFDSDGFEEENTLAEITESLDESEMVEQPELAETENNLQENSAVEISEPEVEQLAEEEPEVQQGPEILQSVVADTQDTQVAEESVDDMELAKASDLTEQEEELGNAVASVKETVEKEIKSELAQQVAEKPAPEVSEVVPVQNNPAPTVASPLEESIKDMLKPMLKEWLDSNMPRLLEDAMKQQAQEDKKK